MGRIDYHSMGFLALLLISTVFLGCSRENNSQNTFCLEEFEAAMTDKGYNFEIKDVEQDFLPTTRNRMIIDDIAIDIYIFNSDEKMESEASNIDSSGYSYDNGSKALNVSWVSFPHFYKKGSLIVQYIGEDENIISALDDILGEQFAGYTPK
ncbi:MAG: hypothetical protein PHF63_14075 [Herbinix sp.]|nr:hypothetical protein [Herbinix sp.]